MKVLTKAELIRLAPDRWEATYYKGLRGWESLWGGTRTDKVYAQLRDLVDPTEDKIEALIGNRSWTRLECGVCKQDVDKIVMFPCGEYTLYVCQNCISQAHKELSNARCGHYKRVHTFIKTDEIDMSPCASCKCGHFEGVDLDDTPLGEKLEAFIGSPDQATLGLLLREWILAGGGAKRMAEDSG